MPSVNSKGNKLSLRPECSHNNPMGSGPSKVTHIPGPHSTTHWQQVDTVVHALQEQVCSSAHKTKPTNVPHNHLSLINVVLPESRLTNPHVHANTQVHTQTCMSTYLHIQTHVCAHAHANTRVHTHARPQASISPCTSTWPLSCS